MVLARFFTTVYAFNTTGRREDVWKELCGLTERIKKACLVAGDFNCV